MRILMMTKFSILKMIYENKELHEETNLVLDNLFEGVISKDNKGLKYLNKGGHAILREIVFRSEDEADFIEALTNPLEQSREKLTTLLDKKMFGLH